MLKLRQIREAISQSLFFVPMLFVLAAVALGQAMLWVDDRVEGLPTQFTATVDSARAVLSVVGGATLTFAGIAFSVSLLLISLAASQYSPRVVHGLFRDPYNKRIMGIVVGTFTYSLVVLRAVRGPLEEGSEAVVPSLSILLAVALGIISVLSIVSFISHSAHSMDVSQILQDVTEEALENIRANWPEPGEEPATPFAEPPPPDDGFDVRFERDGWIQQIDHRALLGALEPGATLWLATVPGRFAIPHSTICTIAPPPEDVEATRRRVVKAVVLGETRTMQQDAAYGARQLADVALKALSPGINDPTTAQDALFHLGAVVGEMLTRNPPPRLIEGDEGRRLVSPDEVTHDGLVASAFDEVRVASASQPTVQVYLLALLKLLIDALEGRQRHEARAALQRQAELVVATGELATLTEEDHRRVRDAYQRKFRPLS